MGKVFIITEGLENMGALRTGGQGSVYKGRRIGEITSAVKLLPTPIHTEDKNDKSYRDYLNEVEKLKKVNELPNPNVVKILSSGLTESGSFPFIEMEYIEGPDLEELLKAPNAPVFSIPEVIKVADQLSNALAHCHKVGVKHGDIKSNNVKFNIYTGNYVLLDFGLAIMSDEQRRTSLRHAGAIEFMAPEQSEGEMLFQSDVYSFGIILYELLAGTVPFPLNEKGETARNKVMVSHMENPIPDVMTMRRQNLPKDWKKDKRDHEMRVPDWLLAVLKKCLEKESSSRFSDGVELHEEIINSHSTDIGNSESIGSRNLLLERENEELKFTLERYREEKENQEDIPSAAYVPFEEKNIVRISKFWFSVMLLLILGLISFVVYSSFSKKSETQETLSSGTDSIMIDSTMENGTETETQDPVKADDNQNKEINAMIDSVLKSDNDTSSSNETLTDPVDTETRNNDNQNQQSQRAGKYTVVAAKAYFYNSPNDDSRTINFLSNKYRAELTAIEDRNGFIYVMFFNNKGEVTRGWLRKRDLLNINN